MWLLIPIIVYFIIYFIVRHIYSHWKRNGYPTERANLNWYFLKKVYKREFDHVEAVNEAYNSGGHLPFLGIYFLFQPMLLIRDIPLAKTILEHTHNCFNNSHWEYSHGYRRVNILEKLSPVFALSRVEGMFRNIDKFAEYMVIHLKTIMQAQTETSTIDMQHIIKITSANIMGNLIYGVDINMYKQTDSMFSIYKDSQNNKIIYSYTLSHFPKKSVLTYKLRDLMRASVERRETEGYIRKDILQLLVKYRNGNEIGNGPKSNWHIENSFVNERMLSIEKLSKIAEKLMDMSFQTISSTAVMTLLEILQQPNILQKVLDEINNTKTELKNNDKQSAFEIVNSLKYLDACVQETLRLYPSVPIIERVCSKHFNIPQSRFVIGVGNKIIIPVMALQRDERHFPEPLQYKPERFINAEKPVENSMKNILAKNSCIALPLTKVVVKILVMKLLNNFSLELVPNNNITIWHNPAPFIKSRDGFCIKIQSRQVNDTNVLE